MVYNSYMSLSSLINHFTIHRRRWFAGLMAYTLVACTGLITALVHIFSLPGALTKPAALLLTLLVWLSLLGLVGLMALPALLIFAPPPDGPEWRKALFYFQFSILVLTLGAGLIPFLIVLISMP